MKIKCIWKWTAKCIRQLAAVKRNGQCCMTSSSKDIISKVCPSWRFAKLFVWIAHMTLEYAGRGISMQDVGLAQARRPLDTTHHYFEIEILDPGEDCFITIGLARRSYPKHHPLGYSKGSIAYHAEDGNIFIGSRVGIPFGPRCNKGDKMGCGILFPIDYDSEAECGLFAEDGDEPHDGGEMDDNYHECYRDKKDLYEKDREEEGGFKIFFTRNGTIIGQREMRIPKGGFFPTVGMLSCCEKVRVDLRPLTG